MTSLSSAEVKVFSPLSGEAALRARREAHRAKIALRVAQKIQKIMEDMKSAPSPTPSSKFKGLALCHRKIHRSPESLFPSVPDGVSWTYADIKAEPKIEEVVVDMYKDEYPKIFKEVYDYIVIPSPSVGCRAIKKRINYVLAQAYSVLAEGGKVLNNNYLFFLAGDLRKRDKAFNALCQEALNGIENNTLPALLKDKEIASILIKELELLAKRHKYKGVSVQEHETKYICIFSK